jgi:hypothetical protein
MSVYLSYGHRDHHATDIGVYVIQNLVACVVAIWVSINDVYTFSSVYDLIGHRLRRSVGFGGTEEFTVKINSGEC